jgi:hypothetical protein
MRRLLMVAGVLVLIVLAFVARPKARQLGVYVDVVKTETGIGYGQASVVGFYSDPLFHTVIACHALYESTLGVTSRDLPLETCAQ